MYNDWATPLLRAIGGLMALQILVFFAARQFGDAKDVNDVHDIGLD